MMGQEVGLGKQRWENCCKEDCMGGVEVFGISLALLLYDVSSALTVLCFGQGAGTSRQGTESKSMSWVCTYDVIGC